MCGETFYMPKDFEEFANRYGFKDTDEVYTNGSQLVQVYRVKQWLDFNSIKKPHGRLIDAKAFEHKILSVYANSLNTEASKFLVEFLNYLDEEPTVVEAEK